MAFRRFPRLRLDAMARGIEVALELRKCVLALGAPVGKIPPKYPA